MQTGCVQTCRALISIVFFTQHTKNANAYCIYTYNIGAYRQQNAYIYDI